jgi:integrase/recombinase XerD
MKTVGNYFTSIASFFEFLDYEGYADKNPVYSVGKRYIRRYKDNDEGQMRQLISVDEMTKLINSTLDVRDKSIITLLAKNWYQAQRAYHIRCGRHRLDRPEHQAKAHTEEDEPHCVL